MQVCVRVVTVVIALVLATRVEVAVAVAICCVVLFPPDYVPSACPWLCLGAVSPHSRVMSILGHNQSPLVSSAKHMLLVLCALRLLSLQTT